MKIHLVDGTYELFRAFYAMPSMQAPSGQEVGATRGLMRTLAVLLRDEEVTHVGVAFDTVVESFRNDLFDGYKTGEGIDPELWEQFPPAERAAAAMGVVVWDMHDFEADDAIAAAAHRYGKSKKVEQVVICSVDKDLMQCVRGERVVVWDRRREIVYDEPAVTEKMGVPPASIPDFLALVGDTADGIPGLPKWGKKSAGLVLSRYGHLEDIPEDPAEWDVKVRGAAGLAEVLRGHRDEAELYRTLATLRTDVPLEHKLGDLKWRGPRWDELETLCEELGEDGLLERLERIVRP
ncbi:MAG: 5'-3' exonuclease [Polyangiales bacterium]